MVKKREPTAKNATPTKEPTNSPSTRYFVIAVMVLLFSVVSSLIPTTRSDDGLQLRWLRLATNETIQIPVEGEESITATGLGPGVIYLKNMVKKHEIATIIGNTKNHLKTSKLSGGDKDNSGWRSSTMVTTSADNGPKALNDRVRAVTKLSIDLVKNATIQIQRYLGDDHYFPHYDSKQLTLLGVPNKHFTYPYVGRFLTVVIYLTDSDGGHTVFPFFDMNATDAWSYACLTRPSEKIAKTSKITSFWSEYCRHVVEEAPTKGVAVRPVAGDAVLFYSHLESPSGLLGELNPNSFHGGCTVPPNQEKYMMNYWMNIHPHMFEPLDNVDQLPVLEERFGPTPEEWSELRGLIGDP